MTPTRPRKKVFCFSTQQTTYMATLAYNMKVSNPQDSDSGLTCVSCRLLFNDAQDQKTHYKTDLHLFNLKRKIANLPPVTQEVYKMKLEGNDDSINFVKFAALSTETPTNSKKSKNSKNQRAILIPSTPSGAAALDGGKDANLYCELCHKQYSSQNALNTHLKSKKHLDRAEKQQQEEELESKTQETVQPTQITTEPTPMEQTPTETPKEPIQLQYFELRGTEEDPLTPEEEKFIQEKLRNAKKLELEDCLFCTYKSQDLDEYVNKHGLFIPDIEYVSDLGGLITYLGEKISIGNVCLYCNGKGRGFNTTEAVQAHMRDLSHCKLLYEGNEEEYAEFYDFSSDYQGVDLRNIQGPVQVSEDGTELIFSNGKSVGHRSFSIYYNQRYKAPDTRDAILINKQMSEYRMIGWHGQSTTPVDRKIRVMEKKQALANMKLGVKTNGLMRHFRKQMLV